MDWDSYNARINIRGETQRDRDLSYLKQSLEKSINSLSCKTVLFGSVQRKIIFDTLNSTSSKIMNTYKIKSLPNETFLKGQFFTYENNKWLITECDADDEVYTTGICNLCPHSFKFQNSLGEILEYPYYIDNQSVSVEENKFIISSDSKLRIKLSFDDNTKLFSYDKRFMGEVFNGVPQCWKIIDLSTDNGILCVTLEKDEYNKDTDNITLGVCDYTTPTSPISDLIITGSKTIKKLTSQTYSATEDVIWTVANVDESSNNYITTSEITDTSIKLTSGNFVGKYITLTATSQLDSEITTNITIQITNTI